MLTSLEDGNPPEDQAASTGTRVKTWLPLTFICCILGAPALVAVVLVLSLIPTYLSARNLDTTKTDSSGASFSVVYATDLTNAKSTVDLDHDILADNLKRQYGFDDLTIDSAEFGPSPADGGGKRKRAAKTSGDYLSIKFTVKYRPTCRSDECRKKFQESCRHAIEIASATFILTLKLYDGTIIKIKVTFYWFVPINPGPTSATKTSTTTTSTTSTSTTTTAAVTTAITTIISVSATTTTITIATSITKITTTITTVSTTTVTTTFTTAAISTTTTATTTTTVASTTTTTATTTEATTMEPIITDAPTTIDPIDIADEATTALEFANPFPLSCESFISQIIIRYFQ